jgi:hypothetical protein
VRSQPAKIIRYGLRDLNVCAAQRGPRPGRNGASTGPVAKTFSACNWRSDMTSRTTADALLDIIERHVGYSAIELAHIIKGPLAAQPQVNSELHRLMRRGLVERRGIGGGNLPYRYYRTKKPLN